MSKTIDKFEMYLHNSMVEEKKIINNIDAISNSKIDKAQERWSMCETLNLFLHPKKGKVSDKFDAFSKLSDFLLYTDFTMSEIFEVIFYYIEINIKNGILKNETNSDHSKKLLSNIRQHQIIKEHYFDKIQNYTLEDVDLVIDALNKLNVSPILTVEFKNILVNRIKNPNSLNNNRVISKYLANIEKICGESIDIIKLNMTSHLDEVKKCIFNLGAFFSYLEYRGASDAHKVILTDFYMLDFVSKSGNITALEELEMIFWIVDKNIKNGLLEDNANIRVFEPIDSVKNIGDAMINHYSSYEFAGNYALFYRENYMTLNNSDTLMNMNNELDKISTASLIEAHALIKEHYFDKKDSFDKMDVMFIKTALALLNIPLAKTEVMRDILFKKVDKRSKNNSSDTITKREEKEKKPIVKKKVYYAIWNYLNHYFDFNKMRAFKYLTLNEIIFCIALLNKIYIDKDQIDDFIIKTEIFNSTYNNDGLQEYKELREKIEYYKDNPEMMKILEEIDFVYGLIINKDGDLDDLDEYMKMEIELARKIFPYTHDYEYEKASLIDISDEKVMKLEPKN